MKYSKNRYHLKWLILLLVFLTMAQIVSAQVLKVKGIRYIPDIEVLFGDGVKAYQKADYQRAEKIFRDIIEKYPPHQRLTIAYVMLAKSFYQQKKYQQTIDKIDELLSKYPDTNYKYYARYLRALCFYQQQKYYDCLSELLVIADNVKGGKLAEKSKKLALTVIDNNITMPQLMRLNQKMTGDVSSAIITIKLASSYISVGRKSEAIALLQNFNRRHPKNPYRNQIAQLLNRKDIVVPKGIVKVGVILPISGEYSEQAKAVLSGIRFAQKKYNERADVQVELVVRDSKGDIVQTVLAARELIHDNSVLAIIGELERDKTVAIAAAINNYNMPLIVPATSGVDVTKLNSYTFQLNPDLVTRGRKLAEYAINELNLKTFATIAPMDNYGQIMTESFASTVESLGGTILTQKWYYPGTQDLSRQMKSLREVGFNMMNKDSLIYQYTKDLNDIQKRRFDEETIPVTVIDGIFIPCATEDIQYIAPQLAYVNVQAQLLGGENWYEIEELKKVQQYVDGVIFCSGYFKDETDAEFIRFKREFLAAMKRNPDVMELYGYDAMQTFIQSVKSDKLTREEMAKYLRNLQDFQGIRGKISIDPETGVNKEMRLIKFTSGRFELVK